MQNYNWLNNKCSTFKNKNTLYFTYLGFLLLWLISDRNYGPGVSMS